MEPAYSLLTGRACCLKEQLENGPASRRRIVVVLAGPPGSGKSTIAAKVVQRLNASCMQPFAGVIPMDGFHLSRATLDTLPNRTEAYARRGASWTFDSAGVLDLVHMLCQSRSNNSDTILAPSFDHALKDPVAGGIKITPKISFVLLEGNYLLLNEEPWSQIAGLVDDTWFVDVDPQLARVRIAKRHIKSEIERTWEAAFVRAEGNDLLNGVEIRQKLVQPAVVVQSVDE
jgi:pantothenate kinase